MNLGEAQINWMIGDLNSPGQLTTSSREFSRERCKSVLTAQKPMENVHELGHTA